MTDAVFNLSGTRAIEQFHHAVGFMAEFDNSINVIVAVSGESRDKVMNAIDTIRKGWPGSPLEMLDSLYHDLAKGKTIDEVVSNYDR